MAAGLVRLLSHRGPDIGVDGVRAGDRIARILYSLHAKTLAFELVSRWRAGHHVNSREPAEDRKRPGDVVPIADVGKPHLV